MYQKPVRVSRTPIIFAMSCIWLLSDLTILVISNSRPDINSTGSSAQSGGVGSALGDGQVEVNGRSLRKARITGMDSQGWPTRDLDPRVV